MFEQNTNTSQPDKAKEILGLVFVANDHAAKVLQPGIQPFNAPAARVATEWATILSRHFAIGSIGSNQLNASLGEKRIMSVAVVSFVSDDPFGFIRDKTV